MHAVLLDPLDFITRLIALIPPPRFHLLRYHGVLAAHATDRSEVVPGPAPKPAEPTQLKLFDGEATELEPGTMPSSRHAVAWLVQRVFAVDIMVCPRCRGAMRLVEIANDRDGIARVLTTVGLGPRPRPRPRPPLPGQLELKFAADRRDHELAAMGLAVSRCLCSRPSSARSRCCASMLGSLELVLDKVEEIGPSPPRLGVSRRLHHRLDLFDGRSIPLRCSRRCCSR